MLLLSAERAFHGGRLRPLAGLGFTYNQVHDYTPAANAPTSAVAATRLHDDCQAGTIVGCAGGWNNFFRFGVSFDTRDYEPDPNRGVFVDAALDLGSRALGSRYEWARAMLSPRAYFDPFRSFVDLVFAARVTIQAQSRGSPFFGMNYLPSTEDPRTGLGGLRKLRGYKQDRFVGPVMTLVNGELRWTFVRFEMSPPATARDDFRQAAFGLGRRGPWMTSTNARQLSAARHDLRYRRRKARDVTQAAQSVHRRVHPPDAHSAQL